ncbi:glucose/arabinose dehydrogenase [Kordia periserrulae]|uniref:Glucose/arabinose dehydrogenase n=1 Tax=Kordia periserrulae TaxID=701523 RepID=A0A2T6C468_9FLAO|nr:PQQ-dependent sugar dehydrogenase [Kordia periserrulae]PTX63095.1 glucose/arabinose dehydrogenase [Kordia periserrulae]
MKQSISFLVFISLFFMSCGEKQKEVAKVTPAKFDALTPIKTTEEIIEDQNDYKTEVVVDGIDIPWGMTWLPDGSMLVTEREGTLYHVLNGNKTAINNVPEVFAKNQGGLLDVAAHPNYQQNGWIYITYSLVKKNEKGSHTALIRAKLENNALTSIETLYEGSPNVNTAHHFGSRIVFQDGYVYFTIGDRGKRDINPQDITKDGGKVYRLHEDGRIPEDNPFVGQPNAKEAIFSYGHRNPQGMAINPRTGQIWVHEHGPRGGDEINPITKGLNYGWPVITYGINYSGTTITEETAREGMEQPLYYWVPSIAPSGMAFVTSDVYPDLKGHLVVGSLKFQYLELLTLTRDEKVAKREKLLDGIGRVRSVRQGPDGYIYVGIDGKGVLKMIPNTAKKEAKKTTSTQTANTESSETIETNKTEITFAKRADVSKKDIEESYKRGEAVYNNYCAQCHLGSGEGVAKVYPPLAGSDWLTEKEIESIRSVKYGLRGEIKVNGVTYRGIMSPLGLNDKQVADVMNYTSTTWGNETENFYTEEVVSKVEKE